MLSKAAKVNEEAKVGDYQGLARLSAQWAWALSSTDDLAGALAKILEALKYAEKTDSDWAKGMSYANLTMYFTMIGDMKRAKEYFGKLNNLPPQVLYNPTVFAPAAIGLYFAGENRWEESNKVFEKIFETKTYPGLGFQAMMRKYYAWALAKQGKLDQSEIQMQEVHRIYDDISKRFEHVNVQASLMAPIRVVSNQPFETRIDLVNVSKAF